MTLLEFMEVKRQTQIDRILEHCRYGWLTHLEAIQFYGCARLAARVNELESPRYGYRFERKWVEAHGKRWMAYRLVQS